MGQLNPSRWAGHSSLVVYTRRRDYTWLSSLSVPVENNMGTFPLVAALLLSDCSVFSHGNYKHLVKVKQRTTSDELLLVEIMEMG